MEQLSEPQRQFASDHFQEVRRIASRFHRRIFDSGVELDDLVSAGVQGLVNAAFRVDLERNEASALAYIRKKIHGAIQDELRRLDIKSRDERAVSTKIRRARENFKDQDGSKNEIAMLLGIDVDTVERLQHERQLVNIDTLVVTDKRQNVEEEVTRNERIHELLRVMDQVLNEIERDVVQSSVMGDIPLREIGERWGVSESRMCQIEREALRKLRNALRRKRKSSFQKKDKARNGEKQGEKLLRVQGLSRLYRAAQISRLDCENTNTTGPKKRLLKTIFPIIQKVLTETECELLSYFLFQNLSEQRVRCRLKISEVRFRVVLTVALARLCHYLQSGPIESPHHNSLEMRASKTGTISDITRRRVLEKLHERDDALGEVETEDQGLARLRQAIGNGEISRTRLEEIVMSVMSDVLSDEESDVLIQTVFRQQPLERVAINIGHSQGTIRVIRTKAMMRLEQALRELQAA